VPAAQRGRAFGFHRAADHLGAVLGPLAAFALLRGAGVDVRTVFALAAVPAALAMAALVFGVREAPAGPPAAAAPRARAPRAGALGGARPGRPLVALLAAVTVFTLGNSADAFLLLRAAQLGVPTATVPLLWALLHVVKSASSTPGGALSDRVGRRPLIAAGWTVYAAVYLGFAAAGAAWQAWALFAAYGLVSGLTEGAEKALVADLAPAAGRGTAFGWYHAAVGAAALPASLLFGVVWERYGAPAAFRMGAGLAGAALLVLLTGVPAGRRPAATNA
jgi:MFS family permease